VTTRDLDQIAIATLRFLAVDQVEAAKSGHPGAPLGLAPAAHILWSRYLRFDPAAPEWINRDRFVLSCGHASALLYGLIHLAGFDLPLDELRRFRQLGSKTPGHPEHGLTPGVETTTGPLGQGLATAVGMAIAERLLAARFNRPSFPIFDHHVWVFASDGDLMEGVASEAASLAGHLGLHKLVVVWDDNRITIDGSTELAFTEDVGARFAAYGWEVLEIDDGNDLEAIASTFRRARGVGDRPTLVRLRTTIGYGSPNRAGTSKAHGEPLGPAEAAATKAALGWPGEEPFRIPEEARAHWREVADRGRGLHHEWQRLHERWQREYPELGAELDRRRQGSLPADWHAALPTFTADAAIATRAASGKVLAALSPLLPELVGGSADLAGSNNTTVAAVPVFSRSEPAGRTFCFGVREHAMGAAMNGIALSGLLRPYGGTFLVFADYMRPAIRLAALMHQPAVYVLTHDSIFLGEDGPTHQPIAHLASLRAMPNVVVLRPADANEVAAAWRVALERRTGPTVLALSRQALPVLETTAAGAFEGVARGAWVVADTSSPSPEAILLATGSEVALAVAAARELEAQGLATRVVSMPSWELFAAQDRAYRDQVLPPAVPLRLAIEAASTFGWERWVGDRGAVLGLDRFGESAPAAALAEHFGFTVDNVVRRVLTLR
jgi:transketolase